MFLKNTTRVLYYKENKFAIKIFVLKNYIIINATIPTGSMENTIMPDDNILGFRLSWYK